MTTTKAQPLILEIVFKKPSKDTGCAHIQAHIAQIDGDRIRSVYHNWRAPADQYFDYLIADCQIDGDQHDGCKEPYSYGWEIEYRAFSTNLERAEKMTKTLKAIQRKMTKLEQKLGGPKTYGQFLAHFANAINAGKILIPKPDCSEHRHPEHYIHLEPGLAIDAINRHVLRLRNECLEREGRSAIAQAA